MEWLLADVTHIPRILWFATCFGTGLGIGLLISRILEFLIWR